MRSALLALVLVLSALPAGGTPARAAVVQHYTSQGRQAVAPGVEHDWGTAQAANGNQQVQIVEVATDAPDVGFETSLAFDRITARERTSSQALRQSREGHRVVAAINGSTFASWPSGQVSARGLNVRAGELLTAGTNANLSFAVDSQGQARIGTPTLTVELTLPDGSIAPINRVNQGRLTDEAVLYTPRFGSRTWTDASGIEVVIDGAALPLSPSGTYSGSVIEIRRGVGDAPIGAGQLVVSGTGAGATALEGLVTGDAVTLNLTIQEGWEDTAHAVGGRELLVRDRKIEIVPYRTALVTQANPRTAVGITADGRVLLVTVDGRSSTSGGMAMDELAELLIDRGAVSGMNLDGGGSTTLAVRSPGDVEVAVVNTPSDGQERTVATTLHVVSTTPTGPLTALLVSPREANLFVGQERQFVAKGHDDAYNGIPLSPSDINWDTSTSDASVDGDGLLRALAPGEVELSATEGELSATAAVTILSDPGPPTVTAPTATMFSGAIGSDSIPVQVTWTASDAESSVASTELQQSVDGGAWAAVDLPTATTTQLVRQVVAGGLVRFRARATDESGNTSPWAEATGFTLLVHQETSVDLSTQGIWTLKSKSGTLGGSFLRSTTVGASVTLAFEGAQVGWLTNRGPKMGWADVYVDGLSIGRISLRSSAFAPRRLRYVSPLVASAARTIEVRNAGTSARPKVDLDAFIVLVPEPAVAPPEGPP